MEAAEKAPDSGVLYALLAQEEIRIYSGSTGYLSRLDRHVMKFMKLSAGLNETKMQLLLKLGDAYNDAGKYDEASAVYYKIPPLAGNARDIFIARRRIERARFFKNMLIMDAEHRNE
jgi:hypothetical protein